MHTARKPLSILVLIAFLSTTSFGSTILAASCSLSDVQAAVNSAVDGDTVIIPDGSCSWTGGISTTKQIRIRGANVPTRTPGTISTDGTTITDNAGAGILLTVNTGNLYNVEIGNLRFLPGNGTGTYINVIGNGTQVVLLHDVYFNIPNFQVQHAVKWYSIGGVIWNVTFDSTQNLSGACGTQIGSDSGCLQVKSGLPWSNSSTLGALDTTGLNNLYIEDSTFANVGQCPDIDDGGRVVVRHSQYTGAWSLTHGSSSVDGGRQFEFYNNSMTYPNTSRNMNRYFWGRAGTGVITGNSVQALIGSCYGTKSSFQFIIESAYENLGSHGCCTGYACFHQIGAGSGATGACATTTPASCMSSSQSPNDGKQMLDAIYVWNNTGSGQSVGTNGIPDTCGNGLSTTNFFQLNRDYYIDTTGNSNNGAKPGWSPYTYPHPLRYSVPGGVQSTLAPPTGLQVVVN